MIYSKKALKQIIIKHIDDMEIFSIASKLYMGWVCEDDLTTELTGLLFNKHYKEKSIQDEIGDDNMTDEGNDSSNIPFAKVLSMLKQFSDKEKYPNVPSPKFRRRGWNGKGLYVFLMTTNYGISLSLSDYDEDGLGVNNVDFDAMLILHTSDDKYVPWCPSQTDLLSNDWVQLPEDME